MTRSGIALVFGSLLLAGCQTTQGYLSRTTLAGKPILMEFLYSLNADCSSIGRTNVVVIRQPISGKVVAAEGTGFSNFPSSNQRYHCNGRRTSGTTLTYVPNPSFIGQDTFDVEVFFPHGTSWTKTYQVITR